MVALQSLKLLPLRVGYCYCRRLSILQRVWDEIIYPLPNFNGATVEPWQGIRYFIPHFTWHVITYPCLDYSWTMLVKGASDIERISHKYQAAWHYQYHDDVIKRKHFPRYWPFVRAIHRWPVNSPNKGQWRGALMISLICAGAIGSVNTRDAGDLRRIRAHYDVTVNDPPR